MNYYEFEKSTVKISNHLMFLILSDLYLCQEKPETFTQNISHQDLYVLMSSSMKTVETCKEPFRLLLEKGTKSNMAQWVQNISMKGR